MPCCKFGKGCVHATIGIGFIVLAAGAGLFASGGSDLKEAVTNTDMDFIVKNQKTFTLPINSCDKTATKDDDCHRTYTFTTSVSDGEEACLNANIQVDGSFCDPVHDQCTPPLADTWQGTHNMYEVCSVTFSGWESNDQSWTGTADTAVSAYSVWEELGEAFGQAVGGLGKVLLAVLVLIAGIIVCVCGLSCKFCKCCNEVPESTKVVEVAESDKKVEAADEKA